jgi:predicted nucleic-acid-binding protein
LDRNTISVVAERLLQADQLWLEHPNEIMAALLAVRETGADFADALIAELALGAGCDQALTFDRRAQRLPGFGPA